MNILKYEYKSVKGMNDILPINIYKWNVIEKIFQDTLDKYGYNEIRFPIIEKTKLFNRTIGNATDIHTETYNFQDKNNKSLSLRPEGTASCARSMIENNIIRKNSKAITKIWYSGPMFRYERPQKGRYRQFHQLGLEVYGNNNIEQEAELIEIMWNSWNILGINKNIKLEINNLGTIENINSYAQKLKDYLVKFENYLDDISKLKLFNNPLKILDSKNINTQKILKNAPNISDYISIENKKKFDKLLNYLDIRKIPWIYKKNLIRGIDYYDSTVFEWITNELGAQNTICAGGRYNRLISTLNGINTPAVGCAVGLERLILLMDKLKLFNIEEKKIDIYIISDNISLFTSMIYINNIRKLYKNRKIEHNLTGFDIKYQIKQMKKLNVSCTIIFDKINLLKNKCNILYSKHYISTNLNELNDIINKYLDPI